MTEARSEITLKFNTLPEALPAANKKVEISLTDQNGITFTKILGVGKPCLFRAGRNDDTSDFSRLEHILESKRIVIAILLMNCCTKPVVNSCYPSGFD